MFEEVVRAQKKWRKKKGETVFYSNVMARILGEMKSRRDGRRDSDGRPFPGVGKDPPAKKILFARTAREAGYYDEDDNNKRPLSAAKKPSMTQSRTGRRTAISTFREPTPTIRTRRLNRATRR